MPFAAVPSDGSWCPPAARRCTRAPSRACAACGASGVRTRPIDPCRWGRSPCRASLELPEVGESVNWASLSTSTAGRLRCSSAAPPESTRDPDPGRDPSSTTRTGAPMPPPLRLLRESRIHREAPPGRAGAARSSPSLPRTVAATAGGASPRRHAVSCRVVFAADAIPPRRGKRSKLWLRGPDRPLRGRSGPRRQGQVLARARAGTDINLRRPSSPEDAGGRVRMTP